MKIRILITIICLCTNLFSFSIFEREEITNLKEQIEKDYYNVDLHMKLAQEYEKDFKKSKNSNDLKNVYEQLMVIYTIQPKNLQIAQMTYYIGSGVVKMTRDEKLLNDLQLIFDKLKNSNINMEPISYIRSTILKFDSNDTENLKMHIKLMKNAIKENRQFFPAYYSLAEGYKYNRQYDLAIQIANMGINIQPEFYGFYLTQAESMMGKYEEKEDDSECRFYDSKESEKIIEKLKKAIQYNKNPKDFYAKDLLSTTYNRMGKNNLAIFISKQTYEKNPENEIAKINLIRDYSENGEFDKSSELLKDFEPTNEQLKNTINLNYAYIYFSKRDWKNSTKYFEKYLESDRGDFYNYLYKEISRNASEKTNNYSNLLIIPKNVKISEWNNKIIDYLQNNIDENLFISKADNKCKKTEALFYIGLNKLINGDKEKAKELFMQVVNLKAYSYREYIASKYYLENN